VRGSGDRVGYLVVSVGGVMDPLGAVHVAVNDGLTTVTVTGEFDRALAPKFAREAACAAGNVEVDLSQVTFIDSSGISALLRLANAVRDDGRSFRVVKQSARVRRVLDLAGLEDALG
jgi:anti-sigma B factor antagonist